MGICSAKLEKISLVQQVSGWRKSGFKWPLATILLSFTILSFGCVPKAVPPKAQSFDKYDCEIPPETVFGAAGYNLSLAELKAGKFLLAGGSVGVDQTLISLASQRSVDDQLWSYSRCLLTNRDHLQPEQIAWYEELRSFRQANPSPGELIEWTKARPFPSTIKPGQDEHLDRASKMLKAEYCILISRLIIQLDKTKEAFNKRWTPNNVALERETIRDGNTKARDLLEQHANLLPQELKADATALINHYQEWLEQYAKDREGLGGNRDSPYVFVYSFPQESEARFRQRNAQLQEKLGPNPDCSQ